MKNGPVTVAFVVLVGIVALRPLVTETYDSAISPLIAALGSEGNPTPVRTLVFDLAILIAATVTFAARARQGGAGRVRTGLGCGLALLVVAGVVSCWFTGNKRLAINGTIDWLCHPIAAIALAELLDRGWRRRLLVAAIVGSACVQAAACYEQSFVGFAETWEHYQTEKESFWGKQGVALDDPEVELFEARMKARETSGFLSHSNVTASLLVLTGMTAVGVAMGAGWRSVLGRNLPVGLLGSVILAAVFLTGSKGAIVSMIAAGVIWIAMARWGHLVALHRRQIFIASWVAVAIAGTAVFGHGMYHGSLPEASLDFRWQYWTASAGMIAEHPWTGVGRENFGRNYLKHKSIQSPEEVSNPHNLLVQTAADWGVMGLAGLVALLIGGSWAIARGGHRKEDPDEVGSGGGASRAKRREVRTADPTGAEKNHAPALEARAELRDAVHRGTIGWVGVIGVIVVVGRLLLLGSNNWNYLYYAGVTTALCWFAGAVSTWAASDSDDSLGLSRLAAAGAELGLFAFVLHDAISFALFVPATAMMAFAVFALCVSGVRRNGSREVGSVEPTLRLRPDKADMPSASPVFRWVPVACCSLATMGCVVMGVIPVARASARLERAKALAAKLDPSRLEASVREIAGVYQQAADADPLDPTPAAELANLFRWTAAIEQESESRGSVRRAYLADAERAAAAAIERDPYSTGLRRLRRSLARDVAEMVGNSAEVAEAHARAVAAAHDVLDVYPQNPPDWVSLGDTCLSAGEATSRREYLDEALAAYRKALTLDDARPEWEKYHRMRAKDREEVQRKIARIEKT